jgi:hypothetical protein
VGPPRLTTAPPDPDATRVRLLDPDGKPARVPRRRTARIVRVGATDRGAKEQLRETRDRDEPHVVVRPEIHDGAAPRGGRIAGFRRATRARLLDPDSTRPCDAMTKDSVLRSGSGTRILRVGAMAGEAGEGARLPESDRTGVVLRAVPFGSGAFSARAPGDEHLEEPGGRVEPPARAGPTRERRRAGAQDEPNQPFRRP